MQGDFDNDASYIVQIQPPEGTGFFRAGSGKGLASQEYHATWGWSEVSAGFGV